VLSTFPSGWNSSLERQIDQVCSRPELSCEITIRGEHFIASRLERTQLGDQYRLLGLRSLDKLLGEFNAAFMRTLIQVGLGGAVLALFCMLVTSRSVSRPLRSLVAQLKRSEAIGQMPERLALNKGAYELDSLVNAFNRVGDAERRSRRQLELAMHAAESANRLKTEFLTNVSHELRTPMNGVLGMTDLLLGTPLSTEQEEYATTARGSAESLLTLIDGILDFSKLEAHKLQLSESAFQLQQLVNDVAAGVRLQAEQKQIGIETVYPSSVPQHFIGDCGRIRQVLMELVGNAVKFTDKGRVQIGVKCDRSADNALLTFRVRDTGIGIAPDTHDLIFQKFSQVDGSLTRKRGGTGLGLALSKQLVELMGGQIGFSSHPDAGSTFWFTLSLPVVESEAVLSRVLKGAARPC
jgi:signal transduction histidine kinase